MAKKKKINLPKTKSQAALLAIHVIQETFRLIDRYGPEIVKLLARILRFLGKWGATGIQSLREYLDREEKRLSAATKKKTVKTKKAKRKPAKKKKADNIEEDKM